MSLIQLDKASWKDLAAMSRRNPTGFNPYVGKPISSMPRSKPSIKAGTIGGARTRSLKRKQPYIDKVKDAQKTSDETQWKTADAFKVALLIGVLYYVVIR